MQLVSHEQDIAALRTELRAARAAGVMPLGFVGTVADYKDLEAFRATAQRSRRPGRCEYGNRSLEPVI